MIKKSSYIILLLLCFFISGYLENNAENRSQSLADTEEQICKTAVVHASFPNPIEEIIYNYQNILFDFPLLPRVKTNIQPCQLLPGVTMTSMNKLLLKERFLCQSTPKHPYLLQIHKGKAHIGAPKAYYIYALRHLII